AVSKSSSRHSLGRRFFVKTDTPEPARVRPPSAHTAGFGIISACIYSITGTPKCKRLIFWSVLDTGCLPCAEPKFRPNLTSSVFLARLLLITVDTETVTAYIGLGSNLGDRAGNLLMAVRGLMEASFEVNKLSAIYETEPVEMDDAPGFLNMVAEIRAESITPTQMLARMLRIEYLLGRKEKSLKLPRTIDIDLLFYGDLKMETPFLTLPHPRI